MLHPNPIHSRLRLDPVQSLPQPIPAPLPAPALSRISPMLRFLLALALPFQPLIDQISPTHGFINRQALAILQADERRREVAWLDRYLAPFNEGCDWADTAWKNVTHMYDPETGRGLPGWPHARQMVREYWEMAAYHFQRQEMDQSFFFLGSAAHLVQDMCVPHHAAARLFAGHTRFEAYARELRERFPARRGGLYSLATAPEGWVVANATYTRAHYSGCLRAGPAWRRVFHRAIMDLLPRAQRTTAGFVAAFLYEMRAL